MTSPYTFLRAAVPYVRALRGKVLVVKLGGELLEQADVRLHLFEQLGLLHSLGMQVVVVHGGGPQIASACRSQGLPVETIDGRRVTSPAVLETVTMVLAGSLQSRIVAEMRGLGLPAMGLSGIDANLISATRRPPVSNGNGPAVDYGEVGDISTVNPGILHHLIAAEYLPVVAPVGCDDRGAALNINADTAAAEISMALGAEKLIFLMGVRGILHDVGDPSTLIPELSSAELVELTDRGGLSGGMLPKAAATLKALAGGVRCVHLISGTKPDALLQEIFTNEGSGTMVTGNA